MEGKIVLEMIESLVKKVSEEKTGIKNLLKKVPGQNVTANKVPSFRFLGFFFSLNSMEAVNKVLRSLRKYIRRKKFLNLVKMRIKSEAFS